MSKLNGLEQQIDAAYGTLSPTEQRELDRIRARLFSKRPKPPASMLDETDWTEQFAPAHDLQAWVDATFLGDTPLRNEGHAHLEDAEVGFLWTNVQNTRQGRHVVGTAEIPNIQGNKWVKARMEFQLTEWFGSVPDFLITIDGVYASQCSDAEFCALLEHEMYHCGQMIDEFGQPRFKSDGTPMFSIRGHDVEEFVGVVQRYGPGASSANVGQLVEAANRKPLIALADISGACGTCSRKVA